MQMLNVVKQEIEDRGFRYNYLINGGTTHLPEKRQVPAEGSRIVQLFALSFIFPRTH